MQASERSFGIGTKRTTPARFLLLAATALGPSPALAQQPMMLDTIEVTARRDPERLIDVPVSLEVVRPAESIEAPSNTAVDLSRSVPNYAVTDVGNPRQAFSAVRGVGTLGFPLNPFDTTVGYTLNGAPLSLYAGFQQLLDVNRVEVLRGPQNVLFGRSSQGGTVNIVPNEPDGVRDIRLRGEIGTRGEYLVDAIAGGTIIPGQLNGRGAIRFTGGNGSVPNLVNGDDLPMREIGAARGSLRAFLSERTTMTVSGFFERDDRRTYNFILRGGPNYPATILNPTPTTDRNLGVGTVEIRHALDTFDVTGTFGFQDMRSNMKFDNTDGLIYGKLFGLPSSFFNTIGTDFSDYRIREQAYSGEIRLSSKPGAPIRWTTGASLYRSTFNQDSRNTSQFSPSLNGRNDDTLNLTSASVFGEIGLPLADRLTVTPGVRIGQDSVRRNGVYTSNGTPGVVPTFADEGKYDEGFVAGGITVDYKLDRDSMLYASVKRGYSSGGFAYFNQNAPFGIPATPYPSSYSWTYETGARTTVWDGRLSLEASLFYNDVADGHVYTFDPVGNAFSIKALDFNTYGFEASARARLTEMFTVYGRVGYVHTEFVNVPVGDPTGARNGGRLPGVPAWSGTVGLEQTTSLGSLGLAGKLVSSVELQFADTRPADVPNTFDLGAYALVNARIGWENDRLKAYVFGRNLTDKLVEVAGVSYGPGVEAVTLGLGRVIGFGAEVKF